MQCLPLHHACKAFSLLLSTRTASTRPFSLKRVRHHYDPRASQCRTKASTRYIQLLLSRTSLVHYPLLNRLISFFHLLLCLSRLLVLSNYSVYFFSPLSIGYNPQVRASLNSLPSSYQYKASGILHMFPSPSLFQLEHPPLVFVRLFSCTSSVIVILAAIRRTPQADLFLLQSSL